MKKLIFCLTILASLALSVAACGEATAESLAEGKPLLSNAQSFDEQLAILDKLATENAATLEAGGWENGLSADPAPGLPEGLIPEDWASFADTASEGLPESMRGHMCIAL